MKTHSNWICQSALYATVVALVVALSCVNPVSAQVLVSHDPTALEGNFSAPSNITDSYAYTIKITSDLTSINLTLATTTPVAPDFNLNFTNLYFSTNLADGGGGHSTVGFEIGNNDAFIPGINGSNKSTANDGLSVTSSPGNYQISIPWTYFQTDPDGLGFDKITTANNVVRLNLSQSFGYSVAGGTAAYGNAELGEVALPGTTLSVPEPSVWSLLAAGLVLLTLPRFWRRRTGYL